MEQVDWLVDFYVLVLLLPLFVIRDTVILELPFYSEFSSSVFNLRPHPTCATYQHFSSQRSCILSKTTSTDEEKKRGKKRGGEK